MKRWVGFAAVGCLLAVIAGAVAGTTAALIVTGVLAHMVEALLK